MALVVPNPTVPTNGQALDASPLLANLNAVYQAIQAFDASQIVAGSLVAAAFNASINPNTLMKETTFPFVQTGLVWSTVSGLNGTMTSGVLYFNGIRVPVSSVASNAFAASKDTYIDIDVNGNITYQAVTTNAASPAITANSIRVAICVAGASITYWNQGDPAAVLPIASSIAYSVTDSLGNLIYPIDPNRKTLGYRQITTATSTTTSITDVQVVGLSCPVIVPAGRKAKITIYTRDVYVGAATAQLWLAIWDGVVGSGTLLESAVIFAGASSQPFPLQVTVYVLPTSSNKTYNAAFHTGTGANSMNLEAGATYPAYILVELE